MTTKTVKILGLLSVSALGVGLSTSLVQAKSSNQEKTITVATDSDTAPFTYKKGDDFEGYDIDLVEAIFEDSDKYEVKFVTTAFDSILTGLDAGRFQIAANNFGYNEERGEKYLFSDPVTKSNLGIASPKGTSYDSLDDLSGKKTELLPGTNYAQILENWNKENPDKKPIDIKYASSSTGISTRLQHIETGAIDFILYDEISASYIVKDQGYDFTVTGVKDDLGGEKDGLEFLLFADNKEGKELQTFVNKRLKELHKDGTLVELSKEHFGADYVSQLK